MEAVNSTSQGAIPSAQGESQGVCPFENEKQEGTRGRQRGREKRPDSEKGQVRGRDWQGEGSCPRMPTLVGISIFTNF